MSVAVIPLSGRLCAFAAWASSTLRGRPPMRPLAAAAASLARVRSIWGLGTKVVDFSSVASSLLLDTLVGEQSDAESRACRRLPRNLGEVVGDPGPVVQGGDRAEVTIWSDDQPAAVGQPAAFGD